MKFKNVKVPEGINVSRHSPLADLFLLSAGTFALFGAVILVAYVMGGTLARHMPVAWENALAAAVIGDPGETAEAGGTAIAQDQAGQAAGIELQALADRLSAHMSLPRDLRLTVHYQDDEAVNAFATLGGHIFVNRGLLQHLPSENALAMVMAHEIAHAANRDPAAAMGGALLLFRRTGQSPEPWKTIQKSCGPSSPSSPKRRLASR